MTQPTADVKRTLLLTLGAMGASSAATGVALLVTRHTARDRAFARQFVAWGAINVAIAAVAAARERRRTAPLAGETEDRRQLHRLLLVNSALDVGYIAAGAAMVASADPLGEISRRYSADAARGDGAGIVVQGALLLGLDTVFALLTR